MSPRRKSAYKAHADLNREIAGHLADTDSQSHLFVMADLYDNIARSIDATDGLRNAPRDGLHFT